MSDARLKSLLENKSAIRLITILAAQGYETRFIGGCVRDALLQRPFDEIDMASTATPEQMIQAFARENIKTIPTGIDHGTITAVMDGKSFEITTLRKDVTTDGRHATVAFTDDWQEDAMRRDFTINAMSVDQNREIYDYWNGQDDLAQNHLRFIGEAAKRIQEDFLRILRYFRFTSIMDWEITDQTTLKTCSVWAQKLKTLSRERIQSELYKLLSGKGCLRVIQIMQEYKILSALIGKTDVNRLEKTVIQENQHDQNDAFLRLLALAGWQQMELEQFVVLSRDNKQRIENLNKINNQKDQKLSKLLYFYGQQSVSDYFFLMQTDWDFSEIENWQKPVFPIKAEDVFHLTNGPGVAVGQLMKKAENHWVNEDFKPSKQELLDFLDR